MNEEGDIDMLGLSTIYNIIGIRKGDFPISGRDESKSKSKSRMDLSMWRS